MNKELNRDQIKYLAILAMLIGHISEFMFPNNPLYVPLFAISQVTKITMVYFLVEGFFKTSSRTKYAYRLLMFGVFTQPIYTLTTKSKSLNMLFTLLLCLLILSLLDNKSVDLTTKTVMGVVLLLVSDYCEGTFFSLPVLSIFLYFAYKKKIKTQTAFFWGLLVYMLYNGSAIVYAYFALGRFMAKEAAMIGLAYLIEVLWIHFVLIKMYNGKRSKNHRMLNQWFFYGFYPLHLVVIYIINTIFNNFQFSH